jgi:peptidoglycan/xylan/chitin deacetylase (PgdA/CDA1 family)
MKLISKANDVLTARTRFRTAKARLARPAASFTFDDFPKSAWTVGGPLIEAHGGRGTYFTSGRYCGVREDGIDYYDAGDLRALKAAGHEIGCHTFAHRKSSQVASAELEADWDRNAAFLDEAANGAELVSFAFPYGDASPRTKAMASRRFPVSRGIWKGVNRGRIDLAQLRVQPLEARSWTARAVEQRVKRAAETGGWLVFFSHDVCSAPSPYGATPDMLKHALDTAGAAGLDILPVRDVHARLGGH